MTLATPSPFVADRGMPQLPLTISELLIERARSQPTTPYTFLDFRGADVVPTETVVTLSMLHRRARAVAAVLCERYAQGSRVLLMYPPGPHFVSALLGCALAGMVAVPVYPPNKASLARTLRRLNDIVSDAGVSVVLTTAAVRDDDPVLASHPQLAALDLFATDDLAEESGSGWQAPAVDPDRVWLAQYTSGSLSAPKGVLLTHANVVANLGMLMDEVGRQPDDVYVTWLPHQHDMGLICGLLFPLAVGIPCVSMSPQAFLRRPARWVETLTRYRATISIGPNFSFDLCTRRLTDEDVARADLSTLRVVWNGSEPIRADTIDRFTERFAPAGFHERAFYPCYGLAEATLIVSGRQAAQGPVVSWFDRAALERRVVAAAPPHAGGARRLVGSGQPIAPGRVLVVEPDTGQPCPAGRVGEIWVAGPHVGVGYLGRAEESTSTFQAHTDQGEGPFMRTGDLGFIHDGELFVTGRIKDLIIINGRNHYPQDIELTVQMIDPALRPGCGAAYSVDDDGIERLEVVQEFDPERSTRPVDDLLAAIRSAIAREHQIQVHAIRLVAPGTLPKTTSGKVRRRATRQELTSGHLTVLAKWDPALDPDALEIEAFIVGHLARLAHVTVEQVDSTVSAVANGLDSLYILELIEVTENWLEFAGPESLGWTTEPVRDVASRLATVRRQL